MVLCESFDDIQNAVSTMSVAEYEKCVVALSAMLPVAESYADIHMRAAQAIRVCIDGESPAKI